MELQTLKYTKKTGWSEQFKNLDSENTLILVFAAPEFIDNPTPIKELHNHFPKSKMIGCSGAGEISQSVILDNSLVVSIVKFAKTSITIVKSSIHDAQDSFKSGEKIATDLSKNKLKSIFVLSDGLKVNGTELVKGLNSVAKKDVVITGGLAGDGKRFEQTWAIFNGEVLTNTVVAAGFYGDYVQVGHASKGGWDMFGPERRVTRSKGNILYELDGQPALKLYKEYLGERAQGLPATGLLFPLAIRKDDGDTHQLVRTILAVDENEQSLTFAGDIPMGYLAQLMRANFDRLIASASEAGDVAIQRMLKEKSNAGPVLAIAISCVGRRLLLGERTEEETESMLETLPAGSKQVGFYSYGELSPYATGNCDLHNQTMTVTTISE